MTPNYWMQTATGGFLDFLTPDIGMIDVCDLAFQLARICRFTGALRVDCPPYSVAEHLVWCAGKVSQAARPYALLHDAHEAYIGDMSSPLKALLRDVGGNDAYAAIADRLDAVIYPAFGLEWPMPISIKNEVKAADLLALATERRDLMQPSHRLWGAQLPEPHPWPIRPVPWATAAATFQIEINLLTRDGLLLPIVSGQG